jgi:hypothetical protein
MANPTVPAVGGAMPGRLSTAIRDPFVRRAFERAEREDGTVPARVAQQPRKTVLGGAEARKELAHA